MAKSGVLSQRITTTMHNGTHIDAPAHVVAGTPFIEEMPLPHFFGYGVVLPMPKDKWGQITYDDLERAGGKVVRPGDVVILNTGWHRKYEDNEEYFQYAPGLVPSAAQWLIERKVNVIGHDTQANHHPLATAIGPHRNGPLLPHLAKEYLEWSGGRSWDQDFPEWEPVHRALFKHGIMGIENVRRRTRRGHRQARDLRLLPVEVGPRRRLHRAPRRHRRPEERLPDRARGNLLMPGTPFADVRTAAAAMPPAAP
jgi:kynurenine formamidase